jgi:hypothetical protein
LTSSPHSQKPIEIRAYSPYLETTSRLTWRPIRAPLHLAKIRLLAAGDLLFPAVGQEPLLTIRDFLMKDSRLGSPGLLAFSFHKNLDDPVSSKIALQYGNEEA